LVAFLVFLIRRYQVWAPARIRANCRFHPSCSEYMILALEKYGPWTGLRMGIGRLLRCGPPNGGVDFP